MAVLALVSCAHKSLEEANKKELSHYIWSLSLAAPAVNSALGPLDPESVEEMAAGLAPKERAVLIELSKRSFHPAVVYEKMHTASLEAAGKQEMLELAKRLAGEAWSEFAQNMIWFYGAEGSEEVEEAMRALDREEFELDMKKAVVVERIAKQSFNQNVMDILHSKTRMGDPAERELYKGSLFVATYLASRDLSMEWLAEVESIRYSPLYQKYKDIFEQVVSDQYDQFILLLQESPKDL